MLIQALIPLNRAPDQERPAPPESGQTRLVLGAAVEVRGAERAAELGRASAWLRNGGPGGGGRRGEREGRGEYTVKPTPPTKFQAPMCQPRILGAGVYQFFWVSIVKRALVGWVRDWVRRGRGGKGGERLTR
jgi:hypothetical protein